MFKRKTPLEKELALLLKQEEAYLQKQLNKTDSRLNQLLESKVPDKLQSTLDAAFAKAFSLIFEKGTDVIEKTYKKEALEQNYQINEYASQLKQDRKSLKAFSKKAFNSSNLNLMLSGVSGVGLGILGIGIPDIALFTGLLLKSIYEIALHYGFSYEEESEKRFILLLIQGALSHNEELLIVNALIDQYIETGSFSSDIEITSCIEKTAACLSKELLYMKFLQGIPLVGAAGGAYDAVYMKRINKFAELKYRKRFLRKR